MATIKKLENKLKLESRAELLTIIDQLITNKRQISKPIEKRLRLYASGNVRGGRTNNDVHKILATAKLLNDNKEDKVRSFANFQSYKPQMIYMKIQIFKWTALKDIRKESRQHKQHKTVIVPPDDYIKIPNSDNTKYRFYVGDSNGSGISQQWINVLIPKNSFNRLQKTNRIIYKGITQTPCQVFNNWENLQYSINEEVYSDMQQMAISNDIIVAVRGIQDITTFSGNIREPEKIDVMKANQEKRLVNKYLTYDINPLATSLEGLFLPQKYFKANCCLPNAILNSWAESYNKHYKKWNLTYQSIWELVYDKEYDENSDMPMTFNDAKQVFRKVRQEAFMYNEKGKLLCHYDPRDEGLKIDTKLGGPSGSPLRVILKDEHVFLITDPNMKRSIALKEFKADELTTPSENYNQAQINKQSMGAVISINDVIYKSLPFIKNSIDDDEPIFVEFILNSATENLKDLMIKLIEINYLPHVQFNKYSQMTKLIFKINNVIISIIPVNFGSDAIATQDVREMTDDTAQRYQELNSQINHNFTSTKYRSNYSENFKEILTSFNRCPETLIFDETFDGETIGIDNIKCYPAILAKDIKNIPVFGKFDFFRKTDVFNMYNLYIVQKKKNYPKANSYKVLMNKSIDVIYGFVLDKIKDYVNILACNVPYKIVKNEMNKDVKKVFDDELLSEKQMKNLLVSSIGKFGTLSKCAERSYIYETEEDAERNKGINDVIPIDIGEKFIYIVKASKKADLVNGFLPIQNMIYDKCRLKVFELIESLPKEVKVLGIKTDCVFIPKDHMKYIDIPSKESVDCKSYKNIGKWKTESAIMPHKELATNDEIDIWFNHHFDPEEALANNYFKEDFYNTGFLKSSLKCKKVNTLVDPTKWIYSTKKVNTHRLKDEYSIKEVLPKLKAKKLLILGEHAGTGKSMTCENILMHFKEKSHFVACPQNTQALEWINKGFNAGTIFDLCAKRIDDNGDVGSNKKQEKEADIIVFEECGEYTTHEWEFVIDYMNNHTDSIIIVNGDLKQNEPTEDLNVNIDKVNYYTNIFNHLFQEQILLKDPKRYKTKELCNKAIQIKEDLFDNGLSPKDVLFKNAKPIKLHEIPDDAMCITYTQDTRRNINHYMHYKKFSDKYFVGLKIKANTRMIIKSGKVKMTVNKNFEYTIKEYTKETTVLFDELKKEDITIPTKRLANFNYCYAFTGHSVQGRSVDVPVVIFDYKHYFMNAKWMYPAMTRNRNLEIYYCDEIAPPTGLDKNYIKIKIDGYRFQDKDRKCDEEDYINVSHVFSLSKKQNHCCIKCKDRMNFINNEGDGMNWTVNRKNNELAHTKENTELMCINCNISLK